MSNAIRDKIYIPLWWIILLALLLRLVFFHGISPSDPFTYSKVADDIAQGHWNLTYSFEQTTRWGILFPLALSYKLFGVNNFSSTLFPLLTSLGTVVVGYFLAGFLGGMRAAILTALALAVFPLEIIYASQPMAESPLSFWLLLSLYYFVRADSASEIKQNRRFFLLCGIALGMAYATKFIAVLIAPFFLFVLLIRRRIQWQWSWIGVGFLIVFLAEYCFFNFYIGNGLYRYDSISSDHASNLLLSGSGLSYNHEIWIYLYWMFIDFHTVGLGFIILLLMILRRFFLSSSSSKKILNVTWILILWSVVLCLILSLYPQMIKPYLPIYKIEAYMIVFSAPLLVALGILLSSFRIRVQITAISLLVISSLPFVWFLQESYRANTDNIRAVANFYQAHRDRPIYAHRTDQRLLRYFDHFQHDELYKNYRFPKAGEIGISEPVNLQNTYVVINQPVLDKYKNDDYPYEILHRPGKWRIVFTYTRPESFLVKTAGKIIDVADILKIAPEVTRKFKNKIKDISAQEPVVVFAAN